MSVMAMQDSRRRWTISIVLVLAFHTSALMLLCHRAAAPDIEILQPVLLELAPVPPAPEVTQPLQSRPLAPSHVETPRSLLPIPTLRQAAVVLPTARPKPARASVAPPQPQPTPAVRATQQTAPATPAQPSPAASPAIIATWQARLVAHIARFKNFPIEAQRRHEQGVVMMHFSMDREGHVVSMAMVQGSGYADLDAEARAWINRADPMPAPPAGRSQDVIDIVLPLHFTLR
jgi:protein TonB